MAVTIGVFENEDDVLEAVRLLREAGLDRDDLRIVVNNSEGAPILSSQSDIPIDEVQAIQTTRDGARLGTDVLPVGGVPLAAGFTTGSAGLNVAPSGGVLIGALNEDGYGTVEVLRDIGIPGDAADRCSTEVESGRYLLVAETEADGSAESMLRHAGAAKVVH